MALVCPSSLCDGLVLATQESFIRHLINCHADEGQLIVRCPGCDKGGLKIKGLESHWRRHHGHSSSHFHHTKKLKRQAECSHQVESNSAGVALEVDVSESSSSVPLDESNSAGVALEVDVSESSSSVPLEESNSDSMVLVVDESESSKSVPLHEANSAGVVLEVDESQSSESVVGIEALSVDDSTRIRTESEPEAVFKKSENISDRKKKFGGQFLLSLKAHCDINNVNTQKVVKETQTLINFVFDSLIEKLQQQEVNLSGVSVNDLKTEVCDVFEGLHSPHLQNKYFHDHLAPVQPRAIPLKTNIKKVAGSSKLKIENHEFFYIPTIEVLEKLLAHPEYPDLTKDFADPDPDVLDCFMKGSNAKNNPVLVAHPDALRLLLYYDETETATGLSVHASHNQKLGAFYLTLDNIDPKYRASLKLISLVGLVNHNILKDNYDRYLKIIMDRIVVDLKKLEEGCVLNNKEVFGTLIAVMGDHAGSHLICGFKCGFTANRLCRWCTLLLHETHYATAEDPSKRRTVQQYQDQISDMEAANTLTLRDKKSKEYGLNRRCELNELQSFHAVCGAPPDLMHTILEGVMMRAVKRIIVHCVKTIKIVTLSWLNSAISDFDYGFSEKDERPSPIKEDHLDKDGKIHQSAAQVWTLSVILPLILGPHIDEEDEHWLNFATLLEISRIVHSRDVKRQTLPYLSSLVASFLAGHLELYGHLPAKEHFLLHLAALIEEFGSLLTYNCMRMEANHKLFKRWVYLVGNYINGPKMLSLRYQLNQAVTFSRSFLKPPKYGKLSKCNVSELAYSSLMSGAESVIRATSLKIDGFKFAEGKCYISIGFDENTPLFAAVHHVVVWPQIVLVCHRVKTCCYDAHLSAYQIEDLTSQYAFYKPGEVKGRRVFHAHSSLGCKYLVLKECLGNSF